MIVGALRRLGLIVGGLAGATLVVSLLLGLAAGSRLARAISVGFYSIGCVLLLGTLLLGARGPLRPVWHDEHRRAGFLSPRGVRKATPDERKESSRTAILLFGLGLGFIVLGAVIDPNHKLS